jgi:phosphatidylglycerophosphate synthase
VFDLHGASVLLQWATGGLLFLWVTTRRREVGLGYGWLIRGTYGLMALASFGLGVRFGLQPVREAASAGVVLATMFALAQSITRRDVGVSGQNELAEERSERVEAMTGIARESKQKASSGAEFDPRLDLVAPALGMVGLVAAGLHAGDSGALNVARMLVGALFLGAVSDGMLLGHWYLVQPGLRREPLLELVFWTGALWLPEVVLLLIPTGMLSAFDGTIDDGYAGMLGWFWAACAVATIILVGVTRAALSEQQYAAVMAATGLLYLAILTAFGTDLVARAILSL